jgi:HEAT repeat protein
MTRLRPLWPVLLLLLGACSPASEAADSGGGTPAREIQDLLTALRPADAAAVPVVKSEWHLTRKRTLERLRRGSPELGHEALRVLREERPELAELRAGLLDVAAHTAPPETEPLLVELVLTFGEDLLVRREATELLGRTAPQRALEVLEPVLRERYDGRTYPPEEQMLSAWLDAARQLEHDPVPLLALIVTDIARQQDIRHLATRTLGSFPSPLGRQALETVLVESTGNGYIRRLALQSLQESLAKEEFCAEALRVQQNESDPAFIDFIESMLVNHCR